MTNKIYLLGLLIMLVLSGCKEANDIVAETSLEKPNILWIVSEDNSPWLGCYGDSLAITPNLDKLALEGILFTNAYSNAPVCAPSRNTLITGMYSPGLGTQHMRSTYSIPDSIQFYPQLLKDAGYYTTNNFKRDYNTLDRLEEWSDYSKTSSYKNRPNGMPFFSIINLHNTHESRLHRDSIPKTSTEQVTLYPYHPDTPQMRLDYAVYYDRIRDLDKEIGKILGRLEEEGLSENTIVFYYSDHGGAVAGTKRFATQQGLNVPLIVRVPKKFKHLTKYKPREKVVRPVSFIDFPPTLMQLAGIPIPKQFQGTPFLNPKHEKNLVFGFAGRMDERINMVRTVTNGKYRYTRNYFSYQPYGSHIQTLWKAKGMQSWHQAFLDRKTNTIQSSFFEPRPFEELYDISKDPYQTKNLANDPTFSKIKSRLSVALRNWQVSNKDAGFIPEAMLQQINEDGHVFRYSQSTDYPIETIMELIKKVNTAPDIHRQNFLDSLASEDSVIQFWAAQGLLKVDKLTTKELVTLKKMIRNVPPETGIVFAEVLFYNNEQEYATIFLQEMLDSPKLMNRVQALNVLSRIDKTPSDLKEKLKELGARQEGRKRPYDARIANYLLERM